MEFLKKIENKSFISPKTCPRKCKIDFKRKDVDDDVKSYTICRKRLDCPIVYSPSMDECVTQMTHIVVQVIISDCLKLKIN